MSLKSESVVDNANKVADGLTIDQRADVDQGTASPEVGGTVLAAPQDGPSVEWPEWDKTRRELGQKSQAEYEGARTKLKRAAAMLAIEIGHRPNHDWKAEAEVHGCAVPESNHAHMAATAATFGGKQADDDKVKQQRSKFLDRTALAIENLVGKVTADLDTYSTTDAGIAALVEVIDESDGISSLAEEQRKAKSAPSQPKSSAAEAIVLKPASVREVRLKNAKDRLDGLAEGLGASRKIAIILDDGETQHVAGILPVSSEEEDKLLAQMDTTEQLVDQFGELLLAGTMIKEETTDIPKEQLDDPEDPQTGYRVAFRHFVFEDGKPIVISPILSNASVVVVANPKEPIFAEPLGKVCHLRTRERRIAEANIADPDRRPVFSAEIRAADDTEYGVCRLWLTTEAAAKPEDNGRKVGVLVEPLTSKDENLPLQVDEAKFKPKFASTISANAWNERHRNFVLKHIKEAKDGKVTNVFAADTWEIQAPKKSYTCDIGGQSSRATVDVREDDFHLVSKAIAELPIIGSIKFSTDPKTGLCLEFGTRWFEYKVFVPNRTASAERNGNLFWNFENTDAQ